MRKNLPLDVSRTPYSPAHCRKLMPSISSVFSKGTFPEVWNPLPPSDFLQGAAAPDSSYPHKFVKAFPLPQKKKEEWRLMASTDRSTSQLSSRTTSPMLRSMENTSS